MGNVLPICFDNEKKQRECLWWYVYSWEFGWLSLFDEYWEFGWSKVCWNFEWVKQFYDDGIYVLIYAEILCCNGGSLCTKLFEKWIDNVDC